MEIVTCSRSTWIMHWSGRSCLDQPELWSAQVVWSSLADAVPMQLRFYFPSRACGKNKKRSRKRRACRDAKDGMECMSWDGMGWVSNAFENVVTRFWTCFYKRSPNWNSFFKIAQLSFQNEPRCQYYHNSLLVVFSIYTAVPSKRTSNSIFA